jgi:hypothetical protein
MRIASLLTLVSLASCGGQAIESSIDSGSSDAILSDDNDDMRTFADGACSTDGHSSCTQTNCGSSQPCWACGTMEFPECPASGTCGDESRWELGASCFACGMVKPGVGNIFVCTREMEGGPLVGYFTATGSTIPCCQ